MYLHSLAASVKPNISHLEFVGPVPSALSNDSLGVLASISHHSPVSIEEDSIQRRFRLQSDAFSDRELFEGLRHDWPLIVGWRILGYALVFRIAGPDRGVWLHQLMPGVAQTEILHGCHEHQS